jgi:hypothetical protein
MDSMVFVRITSNPEKSDAFFYSDPNPDPEPIAKLCPNPDLDPKPKSKCQPAEHYLTTSQLCKIYLIYLSTTVEVKCVEFMKKFPEMARDFGNYLRISGDA